MITKECMYQAVLDTVRRGATEIPPDVMCALQEAEARETGAQARLGLRHTIESLEKSRELGNPCCVDTGWPVFFVQAGNDCVLEGGPMALEEAIREAVREATRRGWIRKTMKHPLTGFDPGDNVGTNIPDIAWKFVPGDSLRVSYSAKGGGSECFGGTRHRVVAFADGTDGILKFIIDSFVEATRSGGICPPSVLGIGIGGTANQSATLAKEAACLRLVGSHHPEAQFRELEEKLYEALNSLGIGILGIGGKTSVLAVNVEYAYTHIAGICVDMSANCMVARRATCEITADGNVTYPDDPRWFGDR